MERALILSLLVAAALPGSAGEATAQAAGGVHELGAADRAGIRAAYAAERHAVRPVDHGHRAFNPGQRWQTRFDGRGFLTVPDAGGWSWGLALQRYGFPGQERDVTGTALVTTEDQRVAYAWDECLDEWYVNDRRGLEHGYTVRWRPADGERDGQPAPLTFVLAVRGDLLPDVAAGGRDVRFVDAGGSTVLTYSGLTVFDAEGALLPARFERVGDELRLSIDERGARYPLTIDPIAQQAYLKASDPSTQPFEFSGDHFGTVAISGDTIVVGAEFEDSTATGVNGDDSNNGSNSTGAAYVFVRDGATWSQQAYLKASNTGESDFFGNSVAIWGDTIVVGAFSEDGGSPGVNGNQGDDSEEGAGAAYVFVRNGTTWSQQAYLKASNPEGLGPGSPTFPDQFGLSVSIWEDTIVVGARSEASAATGVNGNQADNGAEGAGAAYVFVRNGTTWSQQAYLKASNTGAGDNFGQSVDLWEDTLVVSALSEDSSATGVDGNQADDGALGSGAAYVFVRNGTTWSQQAYLKASNTESSDTFGQNVTLWGDTVVVGAYREDSSATGVDGQQGDNRAEQSGAAYVFVRNGSTWSQQAYLKASNTEVGDHFGVWVGLAGDTLVVGAGQEDGSVPGVDGDQSDNGAEDAGAVYLFARSGTTWSQQAYLKASNPGDNGSLPGDDFGSGAAIWGDAIVVGARNEASAASGVDGDQSDNSLPGAGAAYVFDLGDAECFLTIGDGPGGSPFLGGGHIFETLLDVVEDSYVVLLDDIPEFVLPVSGPGLRDGPFATPTLGGPRSGSSSAPPPPEPGVVPPWMADGEFAVQVLMWNPSVFPALPEQYTAGLLVSIQPGGTVLTTPFGADLGGMQVAVELDTNAAGQQVVRFPFSIPGFE